VTGAGWRLGSTTDQTATPIQPGSQLSS